MTPEEICSHGLVLKSDDICFHYFHIYIAFTACHLPLVQCLQWFSQCCGTKLGQPYPLPVSVSAHSACNPSNNNIIRTTFVTNLIMYRNTRPVRLALYNNTTE